MKTTGIQINNIENKKKKGFFSSTTGEDVNKTGSGISFEAAEAYKLLRTNILYSFADEKECKIIGVTSSLRGEGKSLTSVNTAFTLAQANKRVLLIDGDLRRPSVAEKLKLKVANDLTKLLTGKVGNVNEVVIKYSSIDQSVQFDIVPISEIPPNPSELLGSKRMEKLMALCSTHYDYIILALPPVTAVSDALVASKLVDGMLVVVRQDYCDQRSLNEAMRQLKQVNVKILGFVMNGHHRAEGGYYKKYKNNYYQSEYVKK